MCDPTPCGCVCGFSQVLTGAAATPHRQLDVAKEEKGGEERGGVEIEGEKDEAEEEVGSF